MNKIQGSLFSFHKTLDKCYTRNTSMANHKPSQTIYKYMLWDSFNKFRSSLSVLILGLFIQEELRSIEENKLYNCYSLAEIAAL